jgi:hypothetical protein
MELFPKILKEGDHFEGLNVMARIILKIRLDVLDLRF